MTLIYNRSHYPPILPVNLPASVSDQLRCCFVHRLHGRYHELAPHLVPMDYTNDPDCKIPLALIVNMPELKVIVHLLHNIFLLMIILVVQCGFVLP